MTTYAKHVAGLARLRSFDPNIFLPNTTHSREFCDFIVALALAYNDLRDVFIAQILLDDVVPKDLNSPTPTLGEFGGLKSHLMRLLIGILHELLVLIEKNAEIVGSLQFEKLLRQLKPKSRAAWTNVLAATGHKPAHNPQTQLLVFARNNVSFHYGSKALGQGFRTRFSDLAKPPFVSAGAQMATTRFYFADAAAESYMRSVGDAPTVEKFFTAANPVLGDINRAIHDLVLHFMKARGLQ